MIGRIIQILIGVMFFFCSAPQGMANTAIREEVRADFFETSELGNEDGKRTAVSFEEFALIQLSEGEVSSESSVDGSKEVKREHKRTASHKILLNKCRDFVSLSLKKLSKGMAKHPATQDAEQERTAAVRLLEIAALAC